jgi:hypothetical protein
MAKPGAYDIDAKVEAFLKKSGIKCLVSGQFLDKECPTVVSEDAVRVISANLGSGDGGGVGEVLVNMAGACFVHGLLPDGQFRALDQLRTFFACVSTLSRRHTCTLPHMIECVNFHV